VEGAVDHRVGRRVVVGLHRRDEIVEHREVGLGNPADHGRGHHALHRHAQVEDLLYVVELDGADERAATGRDLHKALVGEPEQRVANRGAADARRGHQRLLLQRLPRP
jgi:hypothetical protein